MLYQKGSKAVKIEYDNQLLTLEDWATKLELSLSGIRLRYFKCKNYSNKEILFGKEKQDKKNNISLLIS